MGLSGLLIQCTCNCNLYTRISLGVQRIAIKGYNKLKPRRLDFFTYHGPYRAGFLFYDIMGSLKWHIQAFALVHNIAIRLLALLSVYMHLQSRVVLYLAPQSAGDMCTWGAT